MGHGAAAVEYTLRVDLKLQSMSSQELKLIGSHRKRSVRVKKPASMLLLPSPAALSIFSEWARRQRLQYLDKKIMRQRLSCIILERGLA